MIHNNISDPKKWHKLLAVAFAVTLVAVTGKTFSADAGSPLRPPAPTAKAASTAEVQGPVSYQRDILPQLIQDCSYCHQAYDPHGLLIIDELSSYDALVNMASVQLPTMKRIQPGSPEQSYLWLKGTNGHIQAGGSGWTMPLGQLYSPEFKSLLYRWITQGAPRN